MQRIKTLKAITILLLAALALAGCAKSQKPQEPVTVFLKAMLAGEKDKALGVVCPEWEAQAGLELDAFSGVTGKLEGAICQKAGTDGGYTLITCQGKMVLDYRGELRDRSLEGTTYLVKKIDGDWKVCGYR
jgi:hypothetical protein